MNPFQAVLDPEELKKVSLGTLTKMWADLCTYEEAQKVRTPMMCAMLPYNRNLNAIALEIKGRIPSSGLEEVPADPYPVFDSNLTSINTDALLAKCTEIAKTWHEYSTTAFELGDTSEPLVPRGAMFPDYDVIQAELGRRLNAGEE